MRTDLMSFFKKLKANMIINKKNEQTFYELAIREIATGQKRTGLWAIALSKSDGSLDKAHALYIGLLAEEIKNDIYLEEIKNEESHPAHSLLQRGVVAPSPPCSPVRGHGQPGAIPMGGIAHRRRQPRPVGGHPLGPVPRASGSDARDRKSVV